MTVKSLHSLYHHLRFIPASYADIISTIFQPHFTITHVLHIYNTTLLLQSVCIGIYLYVQCNRYKLHRRYLTSYFYFSWVIVGGCGFLLTKNRVGEEEWWNPVREEREDWKCLCSQGNRGWILWWWKMGDGTYQLEGPRAVGLFLFLLLIALLLAQNQE